MNAPSPMLKMRVSCLTHISHSCKSLKRRGSLGSDHRSKENIQYLCLIYSLFLYCIELCISLSCFVQNTRVCVGSIFTLCFIGGCLPILTTPSPLSVLFPYISPLFDLWVWIFVDNPTSDSSLFISSMHLGYFSASLASYMKMIGLYLWGFYNLFYLFHFCRIFFIFLYMGDLWVITLFHSSSFL